MWQGHLSLNPCSTIFRLLQFGQLGKFSEPQFSHLKYKNLEPSVRDLLKYKIAFTFSSNKHYDHALHKALYNMLDTQYIKERFLPS